MIAIFPDTNLFLQCKDIKNLQWHEISDGEDIEIIITRPVMEEIDRLKQDGNKRRAKRARKANSFLKAIILSEEGNLQVRESNPSVVMSFLTPESKEKLADRLDLSRPDDRIVNEALSFRDKNMDVNVRLLTHDTNPLLTAKNVGLDYIVMPDDWLLSPEPDKQDKIIKKLEEEIDELKKRYPKIAFNIQNHERHEIENNLDIDIKTYEQLSDTKIDRLIAECQSRRPIITDFSSPDTEKPHAHLLESTLSYPTIGIQWKYKPPSDGVIKKYNDKEYPLWIQELEEYFEEFHSSLENSKRVSKVNFLLTNSGNVPAENVIIEINALGGILFVPPKSKTDKQTDFEISEKFPKPPTHPKGKWVQYNPIQDAIKSASILDRFQEIQNPLASIRAFENHNVPILPAFPKKRDRNAFYWKGGKPSTFRRSWIFESEEFRHKTDPEIFEIETVVPNVKKYETAAVQFRVTAKNLPKPFEFTLPIRITYEECDTEAKAMELVKSELPVLNLKL